MNLEKIRAEAFEEGVKIGSNQASVVYTGKLAEIAGEKAYQELAQKMEQERVWYTHKVLHKVYHHICGCIDAVADDPAVDELTKSVLSDIRTEFEEDYRGVNDEFEELEFCFEDFLAKCQEAGKRGEWIA